MEGFFFSNFKKGCLIAVYHHITKNIPRKVHHDKISDTNFRNLGCTNSLTASVTTIGLLCIADNKRFFSFCSATNIQQNPSVCRIVIQHRPRNGNTVGGHAKLTVVTSLLSVRHTIECFARNNFSTAVFRQNQRISAGK